MRIFITGVAGFIGYYLAKELLNSNHEVVGIDNLNDYYDVNLKQSRLKQLESFDDFLFNKLDLADTSGVKELFNENRFDIVVNLAAQAGVRYSLENPGAYVDSNLTGFANILEGCRHFMPDHLVYASSSSVYGGNRKMPFSVKDSVDHPVSLYAATKKSNELMAHAYAHLYSIPVTGLRFFTVYGPWGRPDMAYFKFTKAILKGEPIDIYNHGNMKRDFTYIDDIVKGVVKVMNKPPVPGQDQMETGTAAPYRIYNIGNNKPVELMRFIEVLEDLLGKKAIKNMLPMQPGDVPATYADIGTLTADTGFKPETSIEYGLGKFVEWYKRYYH
ncbi:MAG: NAD-dependent epimerase [Thermodesulfobacteriota bacterium]|nr:NAD-dependent epimerase [Thermodesulfobacteriota bacterium]